jgi:tetratricopeptide (TPR) repeat protein
MSGPPRRTEAEARAILDAEIERLAPRAAALGPAATFGVAGRVLGHAYEWEAAAMAWARAAMHDPDDPEPPFEEGVCLLELERWDDAADRFRRVIDLDARLLASGRDGVEWMENDPAYRLGMAMHGRGDLAAAIEAYEESARRNPVGVDALRELARCHLARKEPRAAIDALARLEQRAVRLTVRAEAHALRAEAMRLARELG